MRRLFLSMLVGISTVTAPPAVGQVLQPTALITSTPDLPLQKRARDSGPIETLADSAKGSKHTAARFLYSLGGAYVGGFVGAVLWGSAGNSECNDADVCGAISGFLVGSALGGAFTGAVPRLENTCSTNRRFGYGVLGSGAAMVATLAVARHNSGLAGIYPFAIAAGATGAINFCGSSP